MKRRGFALWEVVAVLAVLIIVAAVLYPVFTRKPHNPGRRVSCQSNLKLIGFGFKQYTRDHDEKYPIVVGNAASVNSAYGWADALQPYLKNTQIYQCTDEPHLPVQPAEPTLQGYTDYWFNRNLVGRDEKTMKSAVRTIVAGDGNDGHDDTTARYNLSSLPAVWRTDENSPAYRHLDGANYAFADGHVKRYKPEDIADVLVEDDTPTFAVK